MRRMLMATAGALLLAPALAAAQAPAQPRPGAQPQVAQRCLDDLRAFRQQMRQDGLWLSGYRAGYGWPAGTAASRDDQTAARTAPGLGDVGARSGPEARARAADVQAQGGGAIPGTATGQVANPWGGLGWRMPPMQEIRTLHAAAAVMAQRGEEQGCRAVLSELREAYGQYGTELRQAGYDGARLGTWRRQQLAATVPVAQLRGVLRADNITGTDIRNPRDEYLGSIEDVIFDPDTGRISHAVIAHGGFIGIGEDHVAVPWQRLRAAPDLDLFVLDIREEALERAPKLDPDIVADPGAFDRRRQEIDRYWREAAGRAG